MSLPGYHRSTENKVRNFFYCIESLHLGRGGLRNFFSLKGRDKDRKEYPMRINKS